MVQQRRLSKINYRPKKEFLIMKFKMEQQIESWLSASAID